MAALVRKAVIEAEPSDNTAVIWPIAVQTATDDPMRRDRMIAAHRLSQDLKLVLWRNLKRRAPLLAREIEVVRTVFGPVDLYVELKAESERLHRILAERSLIQVTLEVEKVRTGTTEAIPSTVPTTDDA